MYELYMYIFVCMCSNISICIYMLVDTGYRVLGDLSFLQLVESYRVQECSNLGAVC